MEDALRDCTVPPHVRGIRFALSLLRMAEESL